MPITIRRRELIAALGVAVVWPLGARAQQSAMPVIGFLAEWPKAPANAPARAAFQQGMAELGYVEGKNFATEYRVKPESLSQAAADLVHLKVSAIFAVAPAAVAAVSNATTSIPVVGIDLESDPVAKGYVKSLARPGGNITGMFLDIPELSGKQLGLLKEIVPRLSRIAIIGVPGLNALQFAATEARCGRSELRLRFWKCGSRMTSRVSWKPPEHAMLKPVSCCLPLSCSPLRSLSGRLRWPNGFPSFHYSANFQKTAAS
jgi:hypothetical protein